MTTTTIRVKVDTRDRLNGLAADELNGASTDEVLTFLLDEHWKRQCIDQADRWREGHPEEWASELAEADAMDRQWAPDLHETEGPYRSDDPEFVAAGGTPLTEKETA